MGVLSLKRAEMAIERVSERLLRAATALDRADVPYAVSGGNAVAVWVASVDAQAVRSTKDVDLLLRRENLSAAQQALGDVGFEPAEVSGVFMFLDCKEPNPRSAVHVIFAGEKVRPHYAHPAPSPLRASRSPDGFAVLNLPDLLMMKLQAFRDIDRVHVRDLVEVGLIDDALAAQLPPDLRRRLDELRSTPDG